MNETLTKHNSEVYASRERNRKLVDKHVLMIYFVIFVKKSFVYNDYHMKHLLNNNKIKTLSSSPR